MWKFYGVLLPGERVQRVTGVNVYFMPAFGMNSGVNRLLKLVLIFFF